MPPFETKTIEELTDTLIDYRGKTPEKTSDGVKLITAKVIKDGFIQDGNHEFISEENYDSWMRRGLPKQWDILITTEAPLGEVAQLRTPEKVALAQRVILLRGKLDIINQGYYFQTFKSDFVQAELKSRGTGTTVLGIKQSELLKVRIPYYPLPTQQKIAAILSAYDDLIENNTRRIKILEEIAQAIYCEWFVNFRFPGHEGVRIVESELGLIPEGWEVRKLGNVIELLYGKGLKMEDREDGQIPVYGSSGIIGYHNQALEKGPGIIVGRKGNVGSIYRSDVDFFPIDTVYYVKSKLPLHYIFYNLQKQNFLNNDAAVPGLNRNQAYSLPFLVPDSDTLIEFEKLSDTFFNSIKLLEGKNTNLRRTRDLLLPKLISGELDVSELDIRIPEAEA